MRVWVNSSLVDSHGWYGLEPEATLSLVQKRWCKDHEIPEDEVEFSYDGDATPASLGFAQVLDMTMDAFLADDNKKSLNQPRILSGSQFEEPRLEHLGFPLPPRCFTFACVWVQV